MLPDGQTRLRHNFSHRCSARQRRKIAERHGVVSSGAPFGIRSKNSYWAEEYLRKLRMKTAHLHGNARW